MSLESWKSLGLAEAACERFAENGIGEPTPIQEQAIPSLLSGKDISAGSQTGTGKTLAYLLPLLQRLDPQSKAVQAIVLSPTQELAMQLVRVAQEYGEPLGIRTQQLIGGAAVKRQLEKLKLNPQLVIGTPGRLNELVKSKKLKLNQATIVVVDEADQVFALGSTTEVETILWATPKSKQIAFFSATYPDIMKTLEKRWMKDPVRIDIEPEQRVSETISHYFVVCDWRDKLDTARKLLRLLEPSSALLFINNTDLIANYESKLAYEGFAVETLYGDADKQKRAATLARFRDGRCKLLVATDVAARGLDIPGLPLVVNLEPPADADQYVHRAGRTGRMGRVGTVLSIVAPNEKYHIEKYERKLGIKFMERVLYKGKLWDPADLPRHAIASGSRGARGDNNRSDVSSKGARGGSDSSKAADRQSFGGTSAAGYSSSASSAPSGAGSRTREAVASQSSGAAAPTAATGAGRVIGQPTDRSAGGTDGSGAASTVRAGVAGVGRSGSSAGTGKAGNAGAPRAGDTSGAVRAAGGTAGTGKPSQNRASVSAKTAGAAGKPSKPRTAKADKNKGAPKWLKAKRDQDGPAKS
ncbi:DEAD/DEAH box helicase [Paenibacillus herberti]|uniref:DEAD/DEAH box helicase n=1 Tax=Paenibacillus herberti TaxID=1619309 RepID=A0A229P523_9BACL|nr:DEAD/DEAH box helicase [Paenibacillus herberti]OXM17151.1 DEAD/DEAH box helicase [Paenibacillus herberti]